MEKFNNHGLDAINSRVCMALALDDFDDEEQIKHVKSKQVQDRDYTKEYLDLFNKIGIGDLSTISLKNFNGISASFPSEAISKYVGNDYEKQNYQQLLITFME